MSFEKKKQKNIRNIIGPNSHRGFVRVSVSLIEIYCCAGGAMF